MFDHDKNNGKNAPIPFGKGDCTIFRKVMSTEDVVQEFAPALRTSSQAETFRTALQMLGDLCGFGLTYYDFDSSGYVKTATEVSSDNSALMRNIRKHENALTRSLAAISHALLWCLHCGVLPHDAFARSEYASSLLVSNGSNSKVFPLRPLRPSPCLSGCRCAPDEARGAQFAGRAPFSGQSPSCRE